MKKILITCIYLALTVAVCAVGFLLPSTLNDYQDRQIFAKIEHTAMEPPELTYSSSLYDTLRLLSQEHYFVEYPSAASKRTSEDIYTIASELIEQFKNYDILLPDAAYDVTNYNASLQLAIVSDNVKYNDMEGGNTASATDAVKDLKELSESSALDITTAVVWSCSIYFESSYWMNIWIDDKSGKAVAFSMFTEQNLMLSSSGTGEEFDIFAEEAAKFLEDYYELPAVPLQQSVVHSYNAMFEKNNSIIEAYYTIQLKEEDGRLIQMPLRILQDCIILN